MPKHLLLYALLFIIFFLVIPANMIFVAGAINVPFVLDNYQCLGTQNDLIFPTCLFQKYIDNVCINNFY